MSNCSKITDEGLVFLPKRLKELNLTGCVLITNEGLKHLSRLTSLQELSLRRCSLITNDGLKYLPKSIIGLSLQFTSVTQDGVKSMPKSAIVRFLVV